VIERKPARFGDAILLDLDGLGIRDMAYLDGQYLIIAGHPDGSGHSHLYFWRGGSARPERIEVRHFKEYNPEAIIVYPEKRFRKDPGPQRRRNPNNARPAVQTIAGPG
jgi:hypothetical protein